MSLRPNALDPKQTVEWNRHALTTDMGQSENFSTTQQRASCSQVLDTAYNDMSQEEQCKCSRNESTEIFTNTEIQPFSENLQGHLRIPTNKNVYPFHESGRTSDPHSTMVKQKIIDISETQNVLTHCREISTKRPLKGTYCQGVVDVNTHSCSRCGCVFMTKSDVCTDAHEKPPKKHSFIIHEKHGGIYIPYLCSDCGKKFGSSSALIRHQRMHTSDGAYKCPYCDKTFHQSWNLNAHKRTHTGEKPFTCLACGKTFTTSSNLVVHNRSHTGEKPHVCSVCGVAFRRIMHLNRHKLMHSAQRPYLCEVCGKSFRQKWTLNQHERTHSTEQPYVCSKCGQGFKQRAGYNQHNKRHHSTIVLNEPCLLDTVI